MSVAIKISHAKKCYGPVEVIKDLSVDINNGEFFTLLGPSGCGKTTLLRMIAGFNTIEGGDFYFNDERINDMDPSKRNIGMVFQNYAIFPNLSVRKNVEFGLKHRGFDKNKISSRAEEFLELVQVMEHADKMPNQLSGGQQQRVALARALVIQPQVLLMDEPLSNLDAKLRVDMRSAIKNIQRNVGITTVYVTHDQEEAMAVSDRIAVMNEGEILQCAAPQEIYQRPIDLFVASFIGKSNQLKAKVIESGDTSIIELNEGTQLEFSEYFENNLDVIISIRPEEFKINKSQTKEHNIKAKIIDSVFLGSNTHYVAELETGEEVEIIEESDLGFLYQRNDMVYLSINVKKANVFDSETTKSLMNTHNIRGESNGS